MSFLGFRTEKKILRKKRKMIRVKEKITSLCVWTGMQILTNKIEKSRNRNKQDNEGKTPQNSPASLSATALALQPPESSIEQSTKTSSDMPTKNENKHVALTMIMGHESSKYLEEVE